MFHPGSGWMNYKVILDHLDEFGSHWMEVNTFNFLIGRHKITLFKEIKKTASLTFTFNYP
jgi:hypothetical protein